MREEGVDISEWEMLSISRQTIRSYSCDRALDREMIRCRGSSSSRRVLAVRRLQTLLKLTRGNGRARIASRVSALECSPAACTST